MENHPFPYFWRRPTVIFKHPFTARVVGPTQAGKTHFVMNLLENAARYIRPAPTKIYWAYGEKNQKQMFAIQKAAQPLAVHFLEGVPDIEEFDANERNLLIMDDLMTSVSNSTTVANIFTKHSHHRNMSVILIMQNLFHQGRSMRDISLNSKYTILFKNPRDKAQIQILGRQIFPSQSHFLTDAYEQATAKPHGYLILDFDQYTPESQRVKTGIFPPEIPLIFVPKSSGKLRLGNQL